MVGQSWVQSRRRRRKTWKRKRRTRMKKGKKNKTGSMAKDYMKADLDIKIGK